MKRIFMMFLMLTLVIYGCTKSESITTVESHSDDVNNSESMSGSVDDTMADAIDEGEDSLDDTMVEVAKDVPQETPEEVPDELEGEVLDEVQDKTPDTTDMVSDEISDDDMSWYKWAKEDYAISLAAEKTSDGVKLTWTVPTEGTFKYYKIVKSTTTATPRYPGADTLGTVTYINETTYLDQSPDAGKSYYGITIFDSLNQKSYSNFVMVEYDNPKETPDQDIELNATMTEDGVLLKWTRYEGEIKYYKVMTTTDHAFPKYTGDSVLSTIPSQNTTSYVHLFPKKGRNYYAITIVRPDNSRFTSMPAMVEV